MPNEYITHLEGDPGRDGAHPGLSLFSYCDAGNRRAVCATTGVDRLHGLKNKKLAFSNEMPPLVT